METGTVIDAVEPGRIQPDTGGAQVQYALAVVVGAVPAFDDRVSFERNPAVLGFASRVERIDAAALAAGFTLRTAPAKKHRKPKVRRPKKPKNE